jgi:high affinity Mn2+ porin
MGDEPAFALHGQLTWTTQHVGDFASPYSGDNSLHPNQTRSTADATLFAGWRPTASTEVWLNLEVDQGFGLDNTLGMAGFPSGEAYKVGRQRPYLRLPRAFLRQTVNEGAKDDEVSADANQFSGSRSSDRWVFTVGKFGVTDLFDASRYAHDPRHDFLNWTAIDAGTFDYAADAWGFSIGGAVERYAGPWVGRLGFFDLSTIPNSAHLTPGARQFQWVGELERHLAFADHDGKFLVTAYESRGEMARLSDALGLASLTGARPDVALVRHYRRRLGISTLAEMSLSPTLGAFARAGSTDGRFEAYEFTDIDRSLSLGLSAAGEGWHRAGDSAGLAWMRNDISGDRTRYLSAGGLGILVGDGALPHPGSEQITEFYYALGLGRGATVTIDLQQVQHPAYNRDRGPLWVGGLRLHAQF